MEQGSFIPDLQEGRFPSIPRVFGRGASFPPIENPGPNQPFSFGVSGDRGLSPSMYSHSEDSDFSPAPSWKKLYRGPHRKILPIPKALAGRFGPGPQTGLLFIFWPWIIGVLLLFLTPKRIYSPIDLFYIARKPLGNLRLYQISPVLIYTKAWTIFRVLDASGHWG